MNQITDKARLATILKNGFDTGFLSIEKKTLYYFKVRKDKELEFFKSLPFLSSMSPTERKQDKTRGIAYVLLLSKVIEKFDNTHSDQLYVTTKNDKEKYAVQLQPIMKASDELLYIFDKIMITYVIRSITLWPKKIENRNILNNVYSVLFSKIANIHVPIHLWSGSKASGLRKLFKNDKMSSLVPSLKDFLKNIEKLHNTIMTSPL
jgi:hypothetical protein